MAPGDEYSVADRQTDRHVFIWGLMQRKYIDYNSKQVKITNGKLLFD